MLVAGFCLTGPYRHNIHNLMNQDCGFISLGYQKKYINPSTLKRLKEEVIKNGDRVYVAIWDSGYSEKGIILRDGTIDFIRIYPDFVGFNIFLDPPNRKKKFELVVFNLGNIDRFLLREV